MKSMKLKDIVTNEKVCTNINPTYSEVDEFVCSKCGLHLVDWKRVEVDEDDGTEWCYDYELQFCPGCGREIIENDDAD